MEFSRTIKSEKAKVIFLSKNRQEVLTGFYFPKNGVNNDQLYSLEENLDLSSLEIINLKEKKYFIYSQSSIYDDICRSQGKIIETHCAIHRLDCEFIEIS